MKKIITLSMFFIAFSLFAQEETTEEKTEEKNHSALAEVWMLITERI